MIPPSSKFYALNPENVTLDLEDTFFSSLRINNQTFKRTYAGRFTDLDGQILTRLAEEAAALRNVLDVGVSSGITTLELYDAMCRSGHQPRITATDIALDAHIVELLPGLRVLVDDTGYPLQYDFFGVAVRPWNRRLDYLDGMLFFRYVVRIGLAPHARAAFERGEIVRSVKLTSRRLEQVPQIDLLSDNLLIDRPEFHGRFDFVRAANVLNADFFREDERRQMVANLSSYLNRQRSWLLVVRSERNGRHHGTLFSYDGATGFRVLERFGRGSEVEDLIVGQGLGATGGPLQQWPRANRPTARSPLAAAGE